MTSDDKARDDRVEKVRREIARYEHPLFAFDARAAGEIVEVEISCRLNGADVHTYFMQLHPREIDHAQFPWGFQKQLYDSLHDYVVEMFTRNPQRQN
ncbi:MAG: hypothetical protein WA002_01875 [Candidatus Acidiferrales bacterium]